MGNRWIVEFHERWLNITNKYIWNVLDSSFLQTELCWRRFPFSFIFLPSFFREKKLAFSIAEWEIDISSNTRVSLISFNNLLYYFISPELINNSLTLFCIKNDECIKKYYKQTLSIHSTLFTLSFKTVSFKTFIWNSYFTINTPSRCR